MNSSQQSDNPSGTSFHLPSIRFCDDFDEYVARADSGGSTYGLLKRHAFAHSSLRERPTARGSLRPTQKRQRSKSLVQPKAGAKTIADEKTIIRALCEQTQLAENHGLSSTLQVQTVGYRRRSTSAALSSTTAGPPAEAGTRAAAVDQPGRASVPFCRRRSFTVTPGGGLVNEGDEVVPVIPSEMSVDVGGMSEFQHMSASRRSSYNSSIDGGGGGGESDGRSDGSSGDTPVHRVLMLGGPGVGKTALTQQFLTSEFMAAQNTSFDDGREITVPVLLDGEESFVDFIDLPYSGELDVWRDYDVDGYIIVYSITDRRSYQKASDAMRSIRDCSWSNVRPIIIVANKSDLERSRMIGKEEGRSLAQSNDCKYIEVSAILNHKVDDLLVGILKQIRLSRRRRRRDARRGRRSKAAAASPTDDEDETVSNDSVCQGRADDDSTGGCLSTKQCKKNGMFAKLFRVSKKASSKSCENLLTS